MSQLSFEDITISDKRKPSRISLKLEKINKIVKWKEILEIVRVVDYTDKGKGLPIGNLTQDEKLLFRAYINSYLGLLKHYKTFNLWKKMIDVTLDNNSCNSWTHFVCFHCILK